CEWLADVEIFSFTTYRPSASVETRLKIGQAKPITSLSARELLSRHPNAEELVGQLVSGDESKNAIEVRASELAVRLPQLLRDCARQGRALALYSLCRSSKGRRWHIPMMDFRIKSAPGLGHSDLLKAALRTLKQKDGVLLNSGNSYHYYGLRPLRERQ